MTYKVHGIIINRKNFGEADRILTICTKEKGKIKVLAKGVRKTLSKLAGNLEPFCLVKIMLAEGRNFDIVTDVKMLKSYRELRDSPSWTNFSYYLAEIIDRMTAEHEPHPEIFELFCRTLDQWQIEKNQIALSYFTINFLKVVGFKPELDQCLGCDKEIEPVGNYFNYEAGGVFCSGCAKDGFPISEKAIKALRLFLKHEIIVTQKLKTELALEEEIFNITNRYLNFINQKELNTQRFLIK